MTPEEIKSLIDMAHSGDVSAQIELAARYATGDEIQQDYRKAVNWYKEAAKTNDPEATYNLGLMYLFGEGVKKDQARALTLLKSAAELGSHDANILLGDAYAEGNLGLQQCSILAATHYLAACPIGASRSIRCLGKLLLDNRITATELGNIMSSDASWPA